MVAPIVFFSREIYPLRVAKLIAHKVKVCFSSQTLGQQSDHLVKCHPSVNFETRLVSAHLRVNLLIEKPHGYSFVTYDGLVMRLSIADTLFLPAAVGHAVSQVAHVPALIWRFLEQLYPQVW